MTAQTSKATTKTQAENGKVSSGPSPSPALYLRHKDIVIPKKFNIRTIVNPDYIKELGESIKASGGITTPLQVWESASGVFTLNSGFNRILALDLLEWSEPVPVVIIKADTPVERLYKNAEENVARRDVRAYDQAARVVELRKLGEKDETIASRLTLSLKHVQNLVRAHDKLHPSILAYWANPPSAKAELPAGYAFALAAKDHDKQLAEFKAWKGEDDSSSSGGSEGEGEGEGTEGKSTPTEAKPQKAKAILAKAQELTARLKDVRAEAREAGQTKEAIEELSTPVKAQIAALNWVLGKRATL